MLLLVFGVKCWVARNCIYAKEYKPCFDIGPTFELSYCQVFLIDESDGEPSSQPVNMQGVLTEEGQNRKYQRSVRV